MFKSILYRCVCFAIVILILGCGGTSPVVENDSTNAYVGTTLPQLSKPIPPEVLGFGIIDPTWQIEIQRYCQELHKHRIGGKWLIPTGCDCDFPQPRKPPPRVESSPELDEEE